jgi:hypothetical protein
MTEPVVREIQSGDYRIRLDLSRPELEAIFPPSADLRATAPSHQ